jgi:exosome complex component CSL4
MAESKTILPGELLGSMGKLTPGVGTYVHDGQIFAASTGMMQTVATRDPDNKSRKINTVSIIIDSDLEAASGSSNSRSTQILPSVGATIYARITTVQRQQALCSILALQSISSGPVTACAWPFRGILRSQDVRMTEKDRVKMNASVAVGDVIRAEVVSLGDQGGYYLSTAGNEFGVVMAWSKAGNVCVPISWKEVLDEKTGQKEERKVAKPV